MPRALALAATPVVVTADHNETLLVYHRLRRACCEFWCRIHRAGLVPFGLVEVRSPKPKARSLKSEVVELCGAERDSLDLYSESGYSEAFHGYDRHHHVVDFNDGSLFGDVSVLV